MVLLVRIACTKIMLNNDKHVNTSDCSVLHDSPKATASSASSESKKKMEILTGNTPEGLSPNSDVRRAPVPEARICCMGVMPQGGQTAARSPILTPERTKHIHGSILPGMLKRFKDEVIRPLPYVTDSRPQYTYKKKEKINSC